ncbi:hypothetical protein HPB48_009020 [Haemaphysalis longicornis]|uniref:Uncharacterized protein n=1 Tax=Haemaphysalis longicornis TaxID=44386 RepID=A0A9J6H343_HAELO|nr:hypothetical protein HPB48_009020 [Haemaphysalis longicornis]
MSEAENEEERPDDAIPEEPRTPHDADESHDPKTAVEGGESSDATPSGEPEPPYYSPGCPDTDEEEAAGDEGEFDTWNGWNFTMWVLYGSSAATVLIPLAFLLLPLITHTTAPRVVASPSPVAIPCKRATPGLPGDARSINVTFNVHRRDEVMPYASPNITTFCIYNNSRYLSAAGLNFLPKNIHFRACPKLIYWSMSITGGKVTSRNEDFDASAGLYMLFDNFKTWSINTSLDLTFIVTLGGYPEDSADFHRLGPDDLYRHRLVADVYKKIFLYHLGGVNIHWVRDTEHCESGLQAARWKTLATFIFNIKDLFRLNRKDFLVTLIIDPLDRPNNKTFHSLASNTDYIFFTTHLVQQGEPQHPLGLRPTARICYSETLALYAWRGLNGTEPLPAEGASKRKGSMSVPEVCDSNRTFKDISANYDVCHVFEATNRSDAIYIAYYKARSHWKDQMECQVLFDVDFDNVFEECGDDRRIFVMLRYYAFVNGSDIPFT